MQHFFKSFFYKILDKCREKTNHGIVFRMRFFITHSALYLFNLDTFIWLFFNYFKIKSLPEKNNVAFLSMYRPLFWHGNIFETQMAKEIKKQGSHSTNILCGGFLQVCDAQYYLSNKTNNPLLCKDCKLRNQLFYTKNKLDVLWLDDFYNPEEISDELKKISHIQTINEAKAYQYAGLPLGRLVRLSVCRYWLRLTLNDLHLTSYKDFLSAAVQIWIK